jgi:hypothetical protein
MRYPTLSPAFLTSALCLAAAGALAPAFAQDQTATTRLQDATVVARDSTISITRLPIHTPNGTIYRDVTIELQVDAQGHVTLATNNAGRQGVPGVAPAPGGQVALQSVPSGGPANLPIELPQRESPPIVMQIFRAGTYSAPDGSLAHVQDRGNDLVHHVPLWSIAGDGGPIVSAQWYSGPPFMNPRYKRLRAAEITSTDYAYGLTDAGSEGPFGSNAVIGVRQEGTNLRIVSFRHGCCSETSQPVASVLYTYVSP